MEELPGAWVGGGQTVGAGAWTDRPSVFYGISFRCGLMVLLPPLLPVWSFSIVLRPAAQTTMVPDLDLYNHLN